MLENPNVMLLQIRYNNRLDNSVTSAECQRRGGTLSIKWRVAQFLTVLSQTLVPVAFLRKRPNVRLERNLLHQDEVVINGLPYLSQSMTLPVC